MELTEAAEELYALPLEDFTKTRNERAKELKAEDKELSERVKRLEKPTTAAWVVNMLVRHQADLLGQVLELGESLRHAQENLRGDELRELTKQRRQLTAAVTSQARAMARDLGVRISGAVADQVEETLRAAMIDEAAAKAVRTGQLLDALSATGVGELDVSEAVAVPEAIGMTARPVEKTSRKPQLSVVGKRGGGAASREAVGEPGGSGGSGTGTDGDAVSEEEAEAARERAREEERRRAREEAERAVEEAEQVAAKAQRKLEKAGKRVSRLEARSLQLQGELDELRRRASEVEHQLESLDDDLSEAEEKRDRARDRDQAARAAAEEAQAALDELAD